MEARSEPISRQHHRNQGMGKGAQWTLAVVALLGAGYAGWYFWGKEQAAPAAPSAATSEPAPSAPAVAEPTPEVPAAQPAAAESHPLEPTADAQGHPPLAGGDGEGLAQAVTDWLGRERTLRFVAPDGLARRIVSTVDNLARSQAAARLWPLHPVGGRMAVTQTDDGRMEIAPENAARYEPVVRFVVGLDVHQASALYRRVYPVLQQAYEELGYPGQRFNDRLVAVIDHLLQTPEPAGPLPLKLVQVQGQLPSKQPWLRYEFADGDLQALSAGQKILVRMGVGHTQRIKAQLRELRAQITPR
ncbi:MAG: DUF3014 domain-containing protein [Comamonas sp.]